MTTLLTSPPVLMALTSLDGVLPMIPSEAAVLAAGVLGDNLLLVVLATALGVFIGDHLAYGLARSVVGPRLIGRSARLRRAVATAARHLDRRAALLIVTSRFLPGGRVTMNLASGTAGVPMRQFSPASAVAAVAWAAYTVGLGCVGGAAFAGNPLLGLAVGLGLSFVLGGVIELVRRRPLRRPVAAALVAASAAVVVAAPASAAPGRAGFQNELDGVRAAGAVGALAEVRNERGIWRGTSGVAELGTPRPVPVDGRFRAGSITKTFLATVVLQLVDEGRLRLDDPVQAWLPGAVPDGDRITVRHLLNHTSGLYDFRLTLPLPPRPEFLDNRWRTWTPAEQVSRAVANPPTSGTPGREFAYTNTGYILLGQIVEKVTGRPYADEIECRILRPLRLRGTSMPGTSPWIPGPHPHGYVPIEGRGLVDYTTMNPSLLGAGGELISTTRDLNRFFAALLGGHLLPAHLLAEMQTRGVPGGRTYGLGLAWRDTPCGVRVYGNDGDSLAYEVWSFATEDRRRQVTVAITPDHHGDPDDAVDAVLNRVFCG